MVDKGRRDFLVRDVWRESVRFFSELLGLGEKETLFSHMGDHEEGYFDSFESCYPLLSEAGQLLVEEALKRGIEVEGKSKLEIAREIFESEQYIRKKSGERG